MGVPKRVVVDDKAQGMKAGKNIDISESKVGDSNREPKSVGSVGASTITGRGEASSTSTAEIPKKIVETREEKEIIKKTEKRPTTDEIIKILEKNGYNTSIENSDIDNRINSLLYSLFIGDNSKSGKEYKSFTGTNLFSIGLYMESVILIGMSLRDKNFKVGPYLKNDETTSVHPVVYIYENWEPKNSFQSYNKCLSVAILLNSSKYSNNDSVFKTIIEGRGETYSPQKIDEYLMKRSNVFLKKPYIYGTGMNSNLSMLSLLYLDDSDDITKINIEELILIIDLFDENILEKLDNLSEDQRNKLYRDKKSILRLCFKKYNDKAYIFFSKYEKPSYILVNQMISWLINNRTVSIDGISQEILWDKIYKMLYRSLDAGDIELDKYQIENIRKIDGDKSIKLLELAGWKNICKDDKKELSEEILVLAGNLGIESKDTKENICNDLKSYGTDMNQIKEKIKNNEINKFKTITKSSNNDCTNENYDFSQPGGFYFRDKEGKWCLNKTDIDRASNTGINPYTNEALDDYVFERLREEKNIYPKYDLDETVNFLTIGYLTKNRKNEEIGKIQDLAIKLSNRIIDKEDIEKIVNNPIALLSILGYNPTEINELTEGLLDEHRKLVGLVILNKALGNVDESKRLIELNNIIEQLKNVNRKV